MSEALIIGMCVSVIANLILITCNIVLVEIIQSEDIIKTLNKIEGEILMNNPKMSPKDIQKTMRSDKVFFKFWSFTFGIILGFLVSLLSGAILRKKKAS